MNSQLDSLIRAFREAGMCGQESPGKIAALARVVGIEDPRVTGFLAAVAADAREYDLARIEALGALQVRAMGRSERELVARTLAQLLDEDDDPDVRIHAARALSCVMDVTVAVRSAVRHLLDPGEDEDVRHNAFFAIERGGPTDESRRAIEQLVGDERFGSGAARVLALWAT